MLPSLQPSRPKPSQQSPQPAYAQQQQRHAAHSSQQSILQPSSLPQNPPKPRSQVEAMPPFGPPQTPASFFTPIYDSAVRHPVFFTQDLKKPPFPLPQVASQGLNPVASGYIMEQRRAEAPGKTKL